MILRLAVYLFLLMSFSLSLSAQTGKTDVQLRRARALQSAGKLDEAVAILENLNNDYPSNIAISNFLKNTYLKLADYDKVLSLLNRGLSLNPANWRIETEIVDVYLKLDKREKAITLANRLIAARPNNYSVYKTLALVMNNNRLYDETVKIYKSAQKSLKNPSQVTRDLANFYSSRLSYSNATDEFVKFLDADPNNYNYVRRRLSRFNTDSVTVSIVLSRLELGLDKRPENQNLRHLVADYHYRTGNFSQAYEEFILLEENNDSNGRLLLNFIENLKEDKQYLLAILASRKLMALHPAGKYYPKVHFLLAELTELSETAPPFSEINYSPLFPLFEMQKINESPGVPKSILLYDSVATIYGNSLISAKAYYNIGRIYFDRLQNLDEAESSFKKSIQSHGGLYIVEPALLKLADISLERGDLIKAENEYLKLSESAVSKEIRTNAQLSVSRIEYYKGEFDSALYHLNDFIFESNFEDPLMNDALELSILIESSRNSKNAESENALLLYAKADLLSHRRRSSEARQAYLTLLEDYPDSPVSDNALFKAAEMSAIMGRFKESLGQFDNFLILFPESELADRALLAAGEVSERGMKDSNGAIMYYERLLIEHPRSLYGKIARNKVRKLTQLRRAN